MFSRFKRTAAAICDMHLDRKFVWYMKNLFLSIFMLGLFTNLLRADEGLWIPMLLGELNEAEMQAMGMHLSADDIYDINHASLKDAVLIFGGGCTAEIVSDEGLVLTNYHCGYYNIQQHSSLEHDYLKDGFWAMTPEEELPNPGLTVTRLVRMEDVTAGILEGVSEDMTEKQRQSIIDKNSERIRKAAVKGTHYQALIKPFFYGNQYFLFVNEIFEDVRLVGAPPSNIGKFGGDTDNWVWPRHTGDFSVFRIYANENNEPASYAKTNRPYHPLKHFNISLKGVQEDDFTFVFGYPGSTEEYLPASAVDLRVHVENPIRINLRNKRLQIMEKYMKEDPKVRIQYSAKQARVANGWKKWIGEDLGIKKSHAIEHKEAGEERFGQWVKRKGMKYDGLLDKLNSVYQKQIKPVRDFNYFYESLYSVEAIRFARKFAALVEKSEDKNVPDKDIDALIDKLKSGGHAFFKDYYMPLDKDIFMAMMQEYAAQVPGEDMPPFVRLAKMIFQKNPQSLADKVYAKSIFTDEARLNRFLDTYSRKKAKKIKKDFFFRMQDALIAYYKEHILPPLQSLQQQSDSLMRIYMRAQMEMQTNKIFYPDANFTLRVSYGQVKSAVPADGHIYRYFTTLKGIMEKENPDIFDYVVEPKLKELYRNKDYGRYADKDGSLHVGFIANNHTTGGNSGSPVLDADGNLIGINFDRQWEGTMSDLNFDNALCRNITLDIRYCLFVIDKFAGDTRLIDEMDLIE